MTATGNIAEDVEAIRSMIAPGSYSTLPSGQWPWAPPASPDVLARAQAEFRELPEDLIELLSITEGFTAGFFKFAPLLEHVLDYQDRFSFESDPRDVTPPQGQLLRLFEHDAPVSCIEIGGPFHGRILFEDYEIGGRTLAWKLSDAIACTRELYEAGLFQTAQLPFFDYELSRQERKVERDKAYASLRPIWERWHCSSEIARLSGDYYSEPSQPE